MHSTPSLSLTAGWRAFALGLAVACLGGGTARATDEIQVYNAEIAEIGQWTIQQHFNYTHVGRQQIDPPGRSRLLLNGTPELAYGMTEWWEVGLYAPFAVNGLPQFLSNGVKLRNLFVVPDAAKRSFFYGVNFELSYQTPPFSDTRYGLEIRPIIGVRNSAWEFIVNPIVDVGLGPGGITEFTPAARVAHNLGQDRFVGLEYYADFGRIDRFSPTQEQSHQLFGVVDFKIAEFDVQLGAGYGLTSGSDRFVTKAILGYAFPVPGQKANASSPTTMTMARARPRSEWPGGVIR
jgi:hypothetical protein